ncbi:MAG: AAA domain-containing protein, partial [Bacteroidota bacterium]
MRQIIHNYKLRLTNLSQGNRSLKLGRLSSRRDIDLHDLGLIEQDEAEDILRKIIAGKEVRLINKLDARFERTNLADVRLNRIFRTNRNFFEETGTYDLFLGYPFVEGKFNDGTIARCPVLLFPVKLVRDLLSRPRWKLVPIKEEPVVFNKTFFLAFEQFQQFRLPPAFWEEEIESHQDWLTWVNNLYQKVKSYELEVNFNPRMFDLKLERFVDYKAVKMEGFRTGVLTFKPQAVLGIFPQSDSALLQDYQVMEKNPETFSIDHLFQEDQLPLPTEKAKPYIREEERFFVTPVDQSQEAALLKIKHGDSLVIHGPPGTGKSQVIVNMIADAMAHGKRVLVVSQKRAALDVVYKRLTGMGLGRFSVLVHDYRHDRKGIYQKIRRQIEQIPDFQKEMHDLSLTQAEHAYKLLSRETDQLTRQFEDLFQGLTDTERFGIDLHTLYLALDVQKPPLPLEEIAPKWNLSQLGQFEDRLRSVWDYLELLQEDHPWEQRLSFRHYSLQDQDRMGEFLGSLAAQIEALHREYTDLSAALSTRILDDQLNQKRIKEFRKVDGFVADHEKLSDLNAIHQSPQDVEELKKSLSYLEGLIQKMEKRQYLDDGYWKLYESLPRHVKAYEKHARKFQRYVSLDYQRARWFFRRVLQPFDLKLDITLFRRLKSEVRAFTRLHSFYVNHHADPVFEYFPLLESQQEKWAWWEARIADCESYAYCRSITYFPSVRPRFDREGFDRNRWEKSMRLIETLEAFNDHLSKVKRDWNRYLHPTQIERLLEGIKAPDKVQAYLEKLQESFHRDFADLKNLDSLLAQFSPHEIKALDLIKPELSLETRENTLIRDVRNSIYFFWVEYLERGTPILTEVSGRGWNRKGRTYREKWAMRRNKLKELIQRRIKEGILDSIEYNRLNNPVTYRNILHQVSKKRRLWSVRKLVSESWNQGLHLLVPCWLASPESVAAIFPMQRDFFDLVIFDEASQCFVERAIPVMLRGKQVAIAGDEKQLQPLDLYKVKYEETEEDFVENELALEVESILDLAKTAFEGTYLSWHYRSREEELINFSNQAFYEGKLQVIPSATHLPENHPPLSWIGVDGLWDQNRNQQEAQAVIRLVRELINRPDKPSIGIVTFNYHQQELIKDLLDKELEYLAKEDTQQYQLLVAT